VLVKVEAFGLNNSERLVRLEEIGHPWIAPEVVPGIECAGVVVDGGGTGFAPGERVMCLMGGMGREFDGSYAEYALVPARQTIRVPAGLDWTPEEFGAFPETYFTAWGSLVDCLHLDEKDALLVRGATCGLGWAALQLAGAVGCEILATARREDKLADLEAAGATEALLDDGKLAQAYGRATKILDLVGARSYYDTVKCLAPGGVLCETGILGGVESLKDFDPIKDIPNGCYLTGFFSNRPTQETFDAMFAFMQAHGLKPLYARSFKFDDLRSALEAQEAGTGGKIVVTLD
jgi:NADPH:quinone reductase-like Zn-dependent oxidoreductase